MERTARRASSTGRPSSASRSAGCERRPAALTPAELRAAEPAYAEAMARIVPALSARSARSCPASSSAPASSTGPAGSAPTPVSFASLIGKLEADLLDQVVPAGGGLAKATMALANRWITTRQLGFLLGFMGQRVLGQYDLALLSAEATPGRLLFVEENIRADGHAPRPPARPVPDVDRPARDDPRLRVRGAPVAAPVPRRSRLERQLSLFSTDARRLGRDALRGLGRALRGESGGEHWMETLMGEEQRRLFRETQAVMSLLEGFSDYVMDEVGARAGPRRRADQRAVPRAREQSDRVRAVDAPADRHGPQDGAVPEG